MSSLVEALRGATRDLAAAGIASPEVDARILLCAAAGIDRVTLLRDQDGPIGPEASARFRLLMGRRLSREPVSRILGRRAFWGLDLLVTPDVLDPRPDTETLVDAVLRHSGRDLKRAWRILDLGTGSGAILCALLDELPAARGWGIDRSAEACRIARYNLVRLGLGGRSLVVGADWGSCFAPETFDLVVSNPPYIETLVIEDLADEVRRHDPRLALDGGPDGLAAYRALAAQLPGLLAPGGTAFLEVGSGQAVAVSALLLDAGLGSGRSFPDLAGVERVVSALQPK